MSDEILGFLALIACLVWSWVMAWTLVRAKHRKKKDDWYDGDLHS